MLFGFIMAQTFANAQYGFDIEYHSALEKLFTEALSATASGSTTSELRSTPVPISLGNEDHLSYDLDLRSALSRATYDVVGKSGYVHATTSRIARRASCSPGAIYNFHRSKEALAVAAFGDLMASHQTDLTDLGLILKEGHLTELLNREVHRENEYRRNFALEMAIAAGHSDTMRTIILGPLVQCNLPTPDPVEQDESHDQRLSHANQMIATVILAVSWLATISDAPSSYDMGSFAEPLRRCLVAQWFPDGAES